MLISASKMKSFLSCKRCFYLKYKLKIDLPEGIFPSLPGGFDRRLKDHYDTFRSGSSLPPELTPFLPGYRLFADVQLLSEWRSNKRGARFTYRGHDVLCALDDVLVGPNGRTLLVHDYKTRASAPKPDGWQYYIHQLELYTYALLELGYAVEPSATLAYYWPVQVEHDNSFAMRLGCEVVRCAVDISNAIRNMDDMIACIDGDLPEIGKECSNCNYQREVRGIETVVEFAKNQGSVQGEIL